MSTIDFLPYLFFYGMKSQKSGLIIYQISQKAELAVVAVNRVTESEAPKYWALDFSQNTAAQPV